MRDRLGANAIAAQVPMGAEIPAGSKVLIIGADSFRALARDAGYEVVNSADDKPAAVLVPIPELRAFPSFSGS